MGLIAQQKFQFVGLKNQDLWDINQKEKYILEDILNMVKMKTLVFLTIIMIVPVRFIVASEICA